MEDCASGAGDTARAVSASEIAAGLLGSHLVNDAARGARPGVVGPLQPVQVVKARSIVGEPRPQLKVVPRVILTSSRSHSLTIAPTGRDVETPFKNIKRIEKDIDAVLDIHYEYPKFLSAKSIGAFWTPTSFMKDWDLAYVWENQLSHDYLVHTDSPKILKLLQGFRPEEEFGILNHSLPGSWVGWINVAERNQVPHAFYAGINWNKLSGRKGRHHEMFTLLDSADVLNVYGPREIAHVIPWKGFQSYRGEIPFDGKSILQKARESGVSLVLSAEQHLSEGIISSRFFEGLAAGNSIISDGHPFIRKYLGKNGFYLNLERGDKFAADQLLEYMQELRQNPKLLAKQQEFSQNLFTEKFDLTKQLKKILFKKVVTKLP